MNAKDYLRRGYARKLTPSEGGRFSATIEEFSGLFAEGETAAEAYENLESAAESWIEAVLASGGDVPLPAEEPSYSGKVALRMPRGLHQRAAELAKIDEVSLNQWLVASIARSVGEQQALCSTVHRSPATHPATSSPWSLYVVSHHAAVLGTGALITGGTQVAGGAVTGSTVTWDPATSTPLTFVGRNANERGIQWLKTTQAKGTC